MMINWKQRVRFITGPNSGVALLVASATGAFLFMVVAGAFVYGNTRRLITSGEWVAQFVHLHRHRGGVCADLVLFGGAG
jgi:hypothetical protein